MSITWQGNPYYTTSVNGGPTNSMGFAVKKMAPPMYDYDDDEDEFSLEKAKAVLRKPPQRGLVPEAATFIDAAQWGGQCALCSRTIAPGEPIWHYKRAGNRTRIYCSHHKVLQSNNTEDDMSKRQDFTFTYTGTEIADALCAKAQALEDSAEAATRLDEATLAVLFPDEVVRDSQRQAALDKVGRLHKQAHDLREEAKPYRKSEEVTFEIDRDDIAHFGL